LLLKIGNISFSEVAPVECEQPKDGNVMPCKDLDQQGTKSEATAASTTKGKEIERAMWRSH